MALRVSRRVARISSRVLIALAGAGAGIASVGARESDCGLRNPAEAAVCDSEIR